VLVVCGAEKTESAYFKGLCTSRGKSAVNVVIMEKGRSAPDQVVRFAELKDFGGNVSKAVDRARRLDLSGADHTVNPSTGVWRLVVTIMEQS